MESGGISRVIDFLAKRPELDQCVLTYFKKIREVESIVNRYDIIIHGQNYKSVS